MTLEEGPFSLGDSELGEVDISAESSTTLGVPGVLGDAGSCSMISWTSLGSGGRISLGISSLNFSELESKDSSIYNLF